ncbi:MAG TPA: phosphotransferase [Myxococcota bacterium]|nr:phosphotransferase [Myxococcota bacterium]
MIGVAHELMAGRDYSDLRGFEDGTQHHLFRVNVDGEPHVLKIARVDSPFGDSWDTARRHHAGLLAEIDAIRLARVAVPQPSELISTDPPAVLQPHLRGESAQTLWDRGRLGEQGLLDVCFAMGFALAGIHAAKRPADPGAVPDLPIADFEPDRARLLHLDYHLANVQVVRDRRRGGYRVNGVVDWVLCRWGPREADVVEMSISVFHQIPPARGAFMAGYRKAGGLPMDKRAEDRFTLRELVRRLEAGVDDPKVEARWEAWSQELRRP